MHAPRGNSDPDLHGGVPESGGAMLFLFREEKGELGDENASSDQSKSLW